MLDHVLFEIGTYVFTVYHLLVAAVALICFLFIWKLIFNGILPSYFNSKQLSDATKQKLRRNLQIALLLGFVVLISELIGWNFSFLHLGKEQFEITFRMVIWGLFLFQVARFLDWLIFRINIRRLQQQKNAIAARENQTRDSDNQQDDEKSGMTSKMVQYLAYLFFAIYLLEKIKWNPSLLPAFKQGKMKIESSTLSDLLDAIFIIAAARVLAWVLTKLVLHIFYKQNSIDLGGQFAINQLVKYVIYVFALLLALQAVGIDLNLIIGGAAALLVGIGLGLQHIFNDLISGVIILFDRSIEVGDIVDVKGVVGIVKKIGLRTSLLDTANNLTIIVPNSKFISENITNWSHFDDMVRFKITVHVSYESDTDLVKKILLQVVQENVYILKEPSPFVRLINFGESGLEFEVYFWTRNLILIEDVRSDMRMEINRLFKRHNIHIPFPQRDIWLRNPNSPNPFQGDNV